jgi:Rod binding domain-containing protein
MTAIPSLATQTGSAALSTLTATATVDKPVFDNSAADPKAKARKQATDFEAMFLNSMFSQMFTGIDGEGPFGGAGATGVWRSFLSDEYAKSFAKAGGVGLADHVYRALLAQQEVRAN